MKVLFSYPPLGTEQGFATLGQNRQFQYFAEPTFIYPVVPATAATLLRRQGHEVLWQDCLAGGIGMEEFFRSLTEGNYDLAVFETKTPVVKTHWRLLREMSRRFPKGEGPRTVLIGDHVTALPGESMENSPVDFVLTGGDYDFKLAALCRHLENPENPRPDGCWYRQEGKILNTGPFQLTDALDDAPWIDRDLTDWELYAYRNGNYWRTPGTYLMSGRDCWWGKCSFCSWTGLYPSFRVRTVGNVLDEVGDILERYPIREIMDDTGSFPAGEWLRSFCRGAIERGYSRRVGFDCNFRFGAASPEDYRLMRRAGFRFLLFGLESANQDTLDRINKNLSVETIISSCREARRAGLYPHITIMFGYPWESYEEAKKTRELGRYLLRRGYAWTMQATMVVPYPGTPLFAQCRREGSLLTENWDEYDMKRPVMRVPYPREALLGLVRSMYSIAFDPVFLARKLLGIRNRDDLIFLGRAARKVVGHLADFRGKRGGSDS